ncbi:MAG: hypothetical protein QM662_08520 [Gordonia sp. (in: high G+C Gram-positive bacteria)]
MTRLMHYQDHPVDFDRTRTYTQPPADPFGKPTGFWVSVEGDDDWPSWCQSEDFRTESLSHPHEVRLVPAANVWWLTTIADVDRFHMRFSRRRISDRRISDSWSVIDWRSVAALYDGVIIAPYQRSRRELDWYYGWDCASGCIWNLDAIASVEQVAIEAGAAW